MTAPRVRRPLVDPAPVCAHLKALSSAGIGYRRVASLAGVSTRTLWRILYQGSRPTQATAAMLLAVHAGAGPAEKWAPAIGSTRRLQALRALGWSVDYLSARLDMTTTAVSQLALERRTNTFRSTAVKVNALYADLSMTFPPMSPAEERNRGFARRRGWFPPLAWDDETLDDPAALPCLLPPLEPVDRDLELLVQHIVAGHDVKPTPAARREIVRRTPDRLSTEVAKLARCSSQFVSQVRRGLAA